MAGLFEGFVEENPIFTDRAEKHARRAEEAADRAEESATLASTEAQNVKGNVQAAQEAARQAKASAELASEGLGKIDEVHSDVSTMYAAVVRKADEVEANVANLEESVQSAADSSTNAKTSEDAARTYRDQAFGYKNDAKTSANNALSSEINAESSENLARQYANQLGSNISTTQGMINEANRVLVETATVSQEVFRTGDQVAADKIVIIENKNTVLENAGIVSNDRKTVTTLKGQTETLHSQVRVFRNEAELFKNQANNAAKDARTSEQNIIVLGDEISSKQELVDDQLVLVDKAITDVTSKFEKIDEAVESTNSNRNFVSQVRRDVDARAEEVQTNTLATNTYKEEAKISRDEAEEQALLAKEYADQAAGSVKGVTSVNGETGDVVVDLNTLKALGNSGEQRLDGNLRVEGDLRVTTWVTAGGYLSNYTQSTDPKALTRKDYVDKEVKNISDRVEILESSPGGVTSVNGEVGEVTLTAEDVKAVGVTGNQTMSGRLVVNNFVQADKYLASNSQSVESNSLAQKGYVDTQVKSATDRITILENKPQGGVTSVNGETGDVVLSAESLKALPEILPVGKRQKIAIQDSENFHEIYSHFTDFNIKASGRVILSGTSAPMLQIGSTYEYLYHTGNKPKAVDVGAPSLGEHSELEDRVETLENMAGAGVTSVNGQTGSVTLDAVDVNAIGKIGNHTMSGRLTVETGIVCNDRIGANSFLALTDQGMESNALTRKDYVDGQVKNVSDKVVALQTSVVVSGDTIQFMV